ncbi:DUF1080 domain-containing protein [bacterium]|nr:DUF1080 domain-containing protein [bacterium]
MMRLCLAVLVSGGLFLSPVEAQQSKVKTAYLSPEAAGADFEVQGEYVGELNGQKYGAQIIARGDGKFEGVLLAGGLPGEGWDGKSKNMLEGSTVDSITRLVGLNAEAAIVDGYLGLNLGLLKGQLKKVLRKSPTAEMQAPAGAIVLFDGSNVDAWAPGKMEDHMLMGVGTRTKEVFDSFTLHLEFRTPFMPYATGQARGNSGMYLQDQYECQILDSFGLEGLDNECGGIYKNAKPLVNMCYPPLSWQTYDVEFTGAKFDAEGRVTAPGKCTIKHNGVVIQKDLELATTPGGGQANQKPGKLFLQDHGDPVRFRNIWIVKQ